MSELREIFLSIGAWTYLLAGLDIFLESSAFLGLVFSGDSVVILMGVLAAGGIFSFWGSASLVVLCAFLGDVSGYLLGRYRGPQILDRVAWLRNQYDQRHERVERYARRFGSAIILIGRFLPFIRAITPFTMGMAGMDPVRLLVSAFITSVIWAGGFFALGVVFGQHWQLLDSILAPVGGGIAGAMVVGFAVWTAWKYREQLKIAYHKLTT